MFKLIGAVLVALALGGVVDVAARSAAESQIEATVQSHVRGAAGVSASIASFPFLPRLLTSGRAGDVEVAVDRIGGAELALTDVRVAASGVVVDRDRLLPEFDVRVTSVAAARVTVLVPERELSRVLRVPVDVTPRTVTVRVRGRAVEADARVEGEALVLGLGDLPPLRVGMPRTALVPCSGAVRLVDEGVELSCSIDDVPAFLVPTGR